MFRPKLEETPRFLLDLASCGVLGKRCSGRSTVLISFRPHFELLEVLFVKKSSSSPKKDDLKISRRFLMPIGKVHYG